MVLEYTCTMVANTTIITMAHVLCNPGGLLSARQPINSTIIFMILLPGVIFGSADCVIHAWCIQETICMDMATPTQYQWYTCTIWYKYINIISKYGPYQWYCKILQYQNVIMSQCTYHWYHIWYTCTN